jgi:hypothetical protein
MQHLRLLFALTAILFQFDIPCAAQQPAAEEEPAVRLKAPTKMPDAVMTEVKGRAHAIVTLKSASDPNPEGEFGKLSDKIALFALASAVDPDQAKTVDYAAQYVAAGESARTDKQTPASSKTTGSSSAVDKPGIPYLLGLAIDSGAVNKDVSGSTLNLSTSAYALVASARGDTAETYQQFSGFTRLGATAAFNIQNQQDPLSNVQTKNLTEWSVKFRLLGDHSPRSKEAMSEFVKSVLQPLQDKSNVSGKAFFDLFATPVRAKLVEHFSSATTAKIKEYLRSGSYDSSRAEQDISQIILDAIQSDIYIQLDKFGLTAADLARLSEFLREYKLATDAYVKSAKLFDSTLKSLQEKPSLTLAYLQERNVTTSDYSVVKLLFEKKPQSFLQVDANASASFYHKPDSTKNQQSFRDVLVALGLQQNLGKSPFVASSTDQSRISLSFSGSYQRLPENRHMAGKKADLGVANVKLEIPIAGGVSFPISVTYANATELIKESDVRGSFGITFDLDKLRALLMAH